MNVTVLTPAKNRKLVTLEQVKQELEITTTTDDAFLNDIIDRVSGKIEDFTNRIFAKQTYLEKVAGNGSPQLLLSCVPIVSVTSVLCDSDQITDYEIQDAEAGILYRQAGWTWDASLWWKNSSFPSFASQRQNFTIQYIAGYILPGEDKPQTLPKSIEDACIQGVKEMYFNRKEEPGITSLKLGNYAVTYDLTSTFSRLINNWVRVF